MPKRRKSRFSIENLLSHSAEKFRRGILQCCVSENFRSPKSLSIKTGGGEGGLGVSVENFFSVLKNFVRESFSVSLISGIEKFYA